MKRREMRQRGKTKLLIAQKGIGVYRSKWKGGSTAYQSITLSVPFAEDRINLI